LTTSLLLFQFCCVNYCNVVLIYSFYWSVRVGDTSVYGVIGLAYILLLWRWLMTVALRWLTWLCGMIVC